MSLRHPCPPRRAAAVVVTALLALAPLAGRALAADPDIPFERYRLDNGLEVILHRDPSVPLVAVDVWYHVGSGDETPGKSGFAHLFEHMMFQGTEHTGEDAHFSILKKIGSTEVNGSTNPDRTNYYEVVPSHELETALWLESDRMGWMLPLLTEKSLANQRDVVRNERRQRYDNVPYGKDRFAVHAALFGDGHPYRFLTIGRHEELEAASLADVRAFFAKWYVPSNATLAIVGDIDVAATKGLVQKWFGTFPKAEKPSHVVAAPTPVTATKRTEISDEFAKLRRIHWAWHSPARRGAGEVEIDIAADILGAEGTGRLHRILVNEKQLAQTVMVYQSSMGFSGVFHVIVDLLPGADEGEVEKVLEAEIAKLGAEAPSVREVRRAATRLESYYLRGLESLIGRAEELQAANHYSGDPGEAAREVARYRAAEPEGVRKAVAAWLPKDARVEVITRPAAAAAAPAGGAK